MKHEHDPNYPERYEQDQHASERSSIPSRAGSTPTYSDSHNSGLRQHRQEDYSPYQPTPLAPSSSPFIGLQQYSGPTPHSSEIQKLNSINPGMGNRIMDDAHEDIVHDREISKQTFDYAIWEAKRRLNVATALTCLSFVGIFACLFLLEPPESIVGAGLCGAGAITPIILALLSRNPYSPISKSNEPAQPNSDTQK